MAKKRELQVTEEHQGKRLDVFLSEKEAVTRSQVKKWVLYNAITLNDDLPKKAGHIISTGDTICIDEEKTNRQIKEEFDKDDTALLKDVSVVFENKNVVVIDKPSGLVTHPRDDVQEKEDVAHTVSVSGWVLEHYPKLWGVGEYANRPGIVHRLDKETSGLMVIAKTQPSFNNLKAQFKNHTVDKRYTALVHDTVNHDHDTIDFAIAMGHDGKMVARPKMAKLSLKNVRALQTGKDAKTEFWVKETFTHYTLVEVKTYTGRTHQIRVHMFAYNHPIVGDPVYKNKRLLRKQKKELSRLFLHAHALAFTDVDGETIQCERPLPKELTTYLDSLHR